MEYAEHDPLPPLAPHVKCIWIAPTGDVDLVGIRFRPGGLFPFLGLDVDGIVGSALDLGDVSATLRRDLGAGRRAWATSARGRSSRRCSSRATSDHPGRLSDSLN